MKMRVIWVVCAALAVSAYASASTIVVPGPFASLGNQTLVPNGDFSSGLAGWTVFPNGVGNFVASPAAGPDGNPGTALAITGPSGIPVASPGYALGQGVSVTPGETYVLS